MIDPSTKLSGLRVLVVEDEAIIAWDMADSLVACGAEVMGPVGSVDEACALLDAAIPDAAVLDINLGNENVYPLIEHLKLRRVPFLFASGYGPATVPTEYAEHAFLTKPFQFDAFMDALALSICRARAG